jgi:hypothetical protein
MRLALVLIELIVVPSLAFADDDAEDVAETLGWVAIVCGTIATLPFVIINKYRRHAIQTGEAQLQIARRIGSFYKPILSFHIMFNAIGYFAGMSHGLLLSGSLESISLSLAITMTVMMASGLLLWYTSSRNDKIFSRLLHGQFGLVLLLISLVILHLVVGAED